MVRLKIDSGWYACSSAQILKASGRAKGGGATNPVGQFPGQRCPKLRASRESVIPSDRVRDDLARYRDTCIPRALRGFLYHLSNPR